MAELPPRSARRSRLEARDLRRRRKAHREADRWWQQELGGDPLELLPLHRYRDEARLDAIDLDEHLEVLDRTAVPAPRPVMRGNMNLPIAIEPDYAPALARIETLCAERIVSLANKDPQADHATALESADRAYHLASFDPYVLMNCGQAWSLSGEANRARRALDQAIELVPYDLLARFFHTNCVALWGSEADAEEAVRIAGRLTVLGFDLSERYRQEWRALSPTLARMEAVLA